MLDTIFEFKLKLRLKLLYNMEPFLQNYITFVNIIFHVRK